MSATMQVAAFYVIVSIFIGAQAPMNVSSLGFMYALVWANMALGTVLMIIGTLLALMIIIGAIMAGVATCLCGGKMPPPELWD